MVARSNTVLLAGVIGAPEESPCGVIGFELIPSARFMSMSTRALTLHEYEYWTVLNSRLVMST